MFTMMDTPLSIVSLIERAEKYFSKKEVFSRTHSGVHRLTYEQIGRRIRSLASVLEKFGVKKGDRVGTLAWNHHRHLEVYFAVPSWELFCTRFISLSFKDILFYIFNY